MRRPGALGSCSPVCLLGALLCLCGVLGHLAPVHRCARSVCCFTCAVSWATRLLFPGVPARCVVLLVRCPGPLGSCSPVCPLGALPVCVVSWATWLLSNSVPPRLVVLCVPCPGPPGSCSPVCPLGALYCLCGVLGHLAPVHRCARSVRCLCVRCPGPLGSCSPVCPLGVLCCVCGVLGHLAPVHRCACLVRCFACAASWGTWLLFTGVPALCVALLVRCPGPLGSCSPVRPLGVLFCVCSVLGNLAPVPRYARSVCCFACAVSWAPWLLFTGVPPRCVARVCGVLGHLAPVQQCAPSACCVACALPWATWLLFTGVPAWCVELLVRCPGPLGSCSPVCPLGALPVCAVSRATWLLFTGVSARRVVLRVRCPGPPGSCSPVCPLGALFCSCGVLGHLAPVYRCARSACCVACAVSWATWLLFTGVPALCAVWRVQCPEQPGPCSSVCPLVALLYVCSVLGHLAAVHRCARSACCFACALSWATWLLFTGVPARCVACVCGVLGHLAPVHRCACLVRCFACAASWGTWLLFTGVLARCVALLVRCPGPLGSCSPVRPLGVLFYVCGVLGHSAPVPRCARSVCCFACAVSWAPWLLFTGVPPRCVACVCGVLGHLAPVQQCAPSACCVVCALSWATWLLFTGVPAWCVVLLVRCPGPLGPCSPVCPLGALPVCAVSRATWLLFTGVSARRVVLRVRCPGPPGSCSPVCPLGAFFCLCGVLGHLAPVYRCARSACCVACAVSWATWLLFTGVPALCAVWRVRCPGPPGPCSPVCPLVGLLYVCSVLGHLAAVHRCARSACCFACALSWATWLLFTGVPARCVACVCGVLGSLAPVHRCARSVRCFTCAVSWATWLLFTGVPARSVALRLLCPGPLGSCSPVSLLGVLFCLCGVLGPLAPVHGGARSVRCLCVLCPGPFGSRSPVCLLGALFCLCVVLGHLAPVHRCARSVCCVACAVSWATWLLFTGVPTRCVLLRVRCPGPLGSWSPVRSPGVLCGVLGPLAPVHRCACSVCCAVGCVCGTSLRGVHSSICTVAIRSRQGLGTPRARTRLSRRRLFVAGRGWVPSGRTCVHPDGGCSVASRGWGCRGCTRPSGRRLVLLGTCPPVVVRCGLCTLPGFAAPGGRRCLAPVRVPWLWPAACLSGVRRGPAWCAAPLPVRSLSVLRSAFPTPWCLPPLQGLAPPALLSGCAGHAEAGREPGSLCLLLAPAEAGALGLLRVVPIRGPAMGLSLAGPSGIGLRLRALRWLACVDPVTDASGFPYRPWFDEGLGWCTGAVSGGRRHFPLRVGGRHPPRSRGCVRVLALFGRVGRAGLPGAFWCASPFPLATLSFCFAWPPPGWGCPCLGPLFPLPSPTFAFVFFFFFSPLFFFSLRPLCLLLSLVYGPGCPGPWRFVLSVLLASRSLALRALSLSLCCLAVGRSPVVAPPLSLLLLLPFLVALRLFFFSPLVCTFLVSGFLFFPAPSALGLGAHLCLF